MELKEVQQELLNCKDIYSEGDNKIFKCGRYQAIQTVVNGVFIACNKVDIYKNTIAFYVDNWFINSSAIFEINSISVYTLREGK